MLAEMVGPSGQVTGLDLNASQLQQGRILCEASGVTNALFVEGSATATGLPGNSFDLVYCRFLLLHLVDPAAGLREMVAVLKPGGVLVVEDGDLTSAGSIPASTLGLCADLFGRLGPTRAWTTRSRGILFYHLVKAADVRSRISKSTSRLSREGRKGFFLKWSVEEAAPAFISAGLVTAAEMETILADMDRDTRNPEILALAPRMSLVWARKPDNKIRRHAW